MNARPDFGGVSRPSSQPWMATGTSWRLASSIAARRCLSSACTPPVPMSPITCNVPWCRRVSATSCSNAGMRKNSPDSMDCEMRTRSMALPSRPGRKPHPSSTTRITGGGARMLRVVVILKGMQVSQITPVLLALLGLATPQVAASQGGNRYRVNVDNAWFHQDVAGRRIARLARGAVLTGGATRNDWIQVMLDGWIFATSVGRSDRPDFDLLVTRAPNENLRAAPA